jgi:hypothetical protein
MIKKALLILIIPLSLSFGQKIGKIAPEKPPAEYPPHSWGIDIMFSEGGLGLGTFFRKSITTNLTGFVDFSFSESKDEREVELIDIFGNTFTVGKKNRVFLLPLYAGIQYRLFARQLTDNLRPYINLGAGPTFVMTTPYELEFFNAFGQAQMKFAAGGYVGLGANIGLSKSNLVGINIRYYYVKLLEGGIENLAGKPKDTFNSIYLTINLGLMY